MLYTIMGIALFLVIVIVATAWYHYDTRTTPAPEEEEVHSTTRKVLAYEDFIMRIAADDVGDPQLEARVILAEQRRKELTSD